MDTLEAVADRLLAEVKNQVDRTLDDAVLDRIVNRLAGKVGGWQIRVILEKVKD